MVEERNDAQHSNSEIQEVQPLNDLPAAQTPTSLSFGLTARAVATGAIGVAITCVVVTWAELVISTIRIGFLQLPPISLILLIGVIGTSKLTGDLLSKKWLFSKAELATVYIMSLVAAMISSHGLAQKLLPLLVTTNYFGTSSNGWHTLFNAHLRSWMVPFVPGGPDRQDVSRTYYENLPLHQALPWQAWLVPLATWSILIGLVFFAFLCLAVMLRKQWVENEKLAFPLAQLPLEILGIDPTGTPFFANPLMWIGVAIPALIYGIDWAHQIAPAVPLIPTSVSLNDYLTTPPWNQLGYTPLIFSFAALGFFYLLPADVSFSIWFFFLLFRLEQIVGVAYNFNMPHMPTNWLPVFEGYQTIGAYFALCGFFVYSARAHLKSVFQSAIRRGRESSESADELISYRLAFWGLWGSVGVSCLILIAMGLSPGLAILELFTVVFLISVVMARSTAEAGMLMTETTFQPYDIYRMGGSMHGLGGANLTVLAFVDHLFSHDQRGLLLTGMLDSAYIGDKVGMRRRSLGKLLIGSIVLAAAVAIPFQLFVTYKIGGLRMDNWMMQGSPQMQFNVNQGFALSTAAQPEQWQLPAFFVVGIVFTIFLMAMRAQFAWWPLHPLGYALAGSQSTIEFWFPCLVAWALKTITLRYGGRRLFQTSRPLFLGLVLGEFVMAVASALVNIIFNIPPPPFPWQ